MNKEVEMAEFESACGDGNDPRVARALRAVVELHKEKLDDVGRPVCSECTINLQWKIYPCLTIQAIEKELG